MTFRNAGAIAVALLAVIASLGLAQAQQASAPATAQALKRTPLQRFDVPGTGYETIIGTVEAPPNASIGRHSHHGVESGYVLEGEMALIVDGQPERILKPGESYQIPAGAIHDGRSGPRGAKVIATYVVEKGKPFATPAK